MESGPASDCRDVLIAAAPQLAALLDDTHAEVRSITAGYLARCLPAASYCWAQVHARWADEHDDGVRADYLISLAQLAQAADRRTETLQIATAWRTPDNAARACAAAHAQLLIDPGDEPAQAVLLAALPEGHPLGTWWGSGSRLCIIETLARSPGGLTRPGKLPAVLEAIAVSHHFAASTMLRLLLCEVRLSSKQRPRECPAPYPPPGRTRPPAPSTALPPDRCRALTAAPSTGH